MAAKAQGNSRLEERPLGLRAFREPLRVPQALRGPLQVWTLFLFTARDYLRSPWVWMNLAGVLLTHLFFFGSAPSRGGFFTVAYFSSLAMAALSTGGIFSRANHAHTYSVLARGVSKSRLVAVGMTVAWLAGFFAYALTGGLVLLRYRAFTPAGPEWLSVGGLASGLAAVGVGLGFAVALLTLLANFVSSFKVRIAVLLVIAVGVMAFDPRSFPIENLRPAMSVMPPLLAPIFGALRFATDPQPDTLARASLLVLAAYTTTIVGLVWWLSSRREVVIE